jgi:hypothetical protein
MAWKSWCNRSKRSHEDNPEDVEEHVQDAYKLLCEANQRGIQVPSDVVSTITQARTAARGGTLDGEIETKFWNAYGLLSSSIKPAERARRIYKKTFYCVLGALLLGQFFYLGGASVRDKMTDMDKQIIEAKGKAADTAEKGTATTAGTKVSAEELALFAKRQRAYLSLAQSMLQAVDFIIALPLRPFGFQSFFYTDGIHEDELANTIIRGKLEMLLLFFSGYLLPILYGLLGACAFVLRKLSDEIDKWTYAYDARVRYTLRLNIGLLAGLAVGWFLKPSTGDPSMASLSPLALAFVAGYGSELFFVFLDKLVNAFAPAGGADTRTTTETTTGGITTTQSSEVAARVAGNTFSRDAERTKTAEAAEAADESKTKAEPEATSAGVVADPMKGRGHNEVKMPAKAESPQSQRSENGKYAVNPSQE